MRSAYDALSAELKAKLEGLRVHHSIAYSRETLGFEFSTEEHDRLQGAVHPLVRTIPGSGRKALYLASHASRIIDWPIPEGRLLLRDLIEHATQRAIRLPAPMAPWRSGHLGQSLHHAPWPPLRRHDLSARVTPCDHARHHGRVSGGLPRFAHSSCAVHCRRCLAVPSTSHDGESSPKEDGVNRLPISRSSPTLRRSNGCRGATMSIRFRSAGLQRTPALLALLASLYVASALSEPAAEKRLAARPSTAASAAATPAAAVPCTGVRITPGSTADDIQKKVDANPPGTVFCFASGTYVLTRYIILKDSNQFICPVRRTCVLTGRIDTGAALAADIDTANQLIKGFVVEHFIDLPDTWPNAGLQLRDRGMIEDNETRFNRTGIHVTSNQTIRGNFIHHNLRYGISGGPADNVLIEGNEIAWNNTARLDPNDDAGGSKSSAAKPAPTHSPGAKTMCTIIMGRASGQTAMCATSSTRTT
jgi:hypothetical protein